MKINGKEFYFDVADVECMERYEKALLNMQEKAKQGLESETVAGKLKANCQYVYEFFDDVLGEGAGNEIFEGKMNFRICFEVYEQFINDCSESCESMMANLSKYSPNRAQRRAK